jgi:hypothetical protein
MARDVTVDLRARLTEAPPTVCKMVHYSTYDTPCVAAVVTGVNGDGSLSLTLFAADRVPYPIGPVPRSNEPANGHWHWPERS